MSANSGPNKQKSTLKLLSYVKCNSKKQNTLSHRIYRIQKRLTIHKRQALLFLCAVI
jgi:hypothetical protein